MLGRILQPEILDLIEKRELGTLREEISEWTAVDVADLISDLHVNEQAVVFRILPKDLASETFEYLELEAQMELLKAMGNEEVASILNEMSPDDRTAFLEELPASITKQLISLLSPSERHVALSLLGYPENSIGRLMTPDYLAVKENWTVQEVLDYIRTNGSNSETLNIIYVTDERGRLVDDIKIREILLADTNTPLSDLLDGTYVFLQADDDQEKAVEDFKKYDRIALPVTDTHQILIGIVTVDDVLDVAEEEATEDIQKMGAVEALDEPYSTIPLFDMIKKRAGWLSLLFVGELLTASAMSYFEHEIQKAVVLALFIPLIISSGGNSGSQTATLVIRALSLGEITVKDIFFVIKRELISGFVLGCILAVLGFLRISMWQFIAHPFSQYWFPIAMTVSLSLIGVVMWGTLMGGIFPLLLKRMGFDPATSSAPFVATLVDVTGLIIYFSFSITILKGILL